MKLNLEVLPIVGETVKSQVDLREILKHILKHPRTQTGEKQARWCKTGKIQHIQLEINHHLFTPYQVTIR